VDEMRRRRSAIDEDGIAVADQSRRMRADDRFSGGMIILLAVESITTLSAGGDDVAAEVSEMLGRARDVSTDRHR